MLLAIYNALNSSSHRAARAFLTANLVREGGWEGWNLDAGRLEDGIAETIKAEAALSGGITNHLSVPFAADYNGCSHGVAGIFGSRFAAALESDGRTLMIDIEITVNGKRATFTDYSFSLV